MGGMAQAGPTATASLSGGTSTKVDLVRRVARLIDDDAHTSTETAGVSSSATSFAVGSTTSPHEYQVGDVLDFLEDGTFEATLVTALPGSPNLTVRRGHRGTTAASHSANAVFRVNPTFLSHVIGEFVDAAVQNLWPDICEFYSATYTTGSAPVEEWFALSSDAEEVLEVYQKSGQTPESLHYARFSAPMFRDAAFAATKKAVKITGLDSTLANFFVIYGARPLVTTLNSKQQEIVVYGAARRALEANVGHRPTTPNSPAIFGSDNKIQLFRQEEQRLRDEEVSRLGGYKPKRGRIVWSGGHHYSEGLD